jgi:hypothetical protein
MLCSKINIFAYVYKVTAMNNISNNWIFKILIIIGFGLQISLGIGQNHSGMKPIKAANDHKWAFYKPLNILSDTNTFIINYDSADAYVWGSSYVTSQMQLMNVHYSTPADSSVRNYDVTNYFIVAFDSLADPYTKKVYNTDSIGGINIDTIIIPLIHVNHSGMNDTLDIQLNSVDGNGYPTSSVLKDVVISNKKIGDTNSSSYASFIKIPENYSLASGTKFAVTVKYYGSKTDSCWFIYGYGSFIGNCGSGGLYTLAEPSNYSKVITSKGSFIGNSFVLYNRYKSNGVYPTLNGSEFFYDCNNDNTYTAGTDGASYFQNINVYAMVTTFPLGINNLLPNNFYVSQNQPNPCNGVTIINYSFTRPSSFQFSVYDVTGRNLISTKYNNVSPGQHSISLNIAQFSPGIYIYTFSASGVSIARKMLIRQ